MDDGTVWRTASDGRADVRRVRTRILTYAAADTFSLH
jgi:hypothetical protein